jgi:hypothetical protein
MVKGENLKYIATDEALTKLNIYGLTEKEIQQEFKGRLKCQEDGNMGNLILNWKNEDIVVFPLGKKTAVLFAYGQDINRSYEDLPEIKYKDNKWSYKVAK